MEITLPFEPEDTLAKLWGSVSQFSDFGLLFYSAALLLFFEEAAPDFIFCIDV